MLLRRGHGGKVSRSVHKGLRTFVRRYFAKPTMGQAALGLFGAALGAVGWWHYSNRDWAWTMIVAATVSSFSLVGLGLLQRPDASRASGHGYLMATMLLLATWGIAVWVAMVLYWRNLGAGMQLPEAQANLVKDLPLAAAAVGGIFALYRSAGTRSTSSALLLETGMLRDHLRRNGRLLEYALIAHRETDSEKILDALIQMLDEAKQLPATSPAVDLLSLWLKDREHRLWYMLADTSGDQPQDFVMEVIETPTPGAGMLANMDAADLESPLVIHSNAHEHEWWKANPQSVRREEGFAGLLLRDLRGDSIGALCLTTQVAEKLDDNEDLREILQTWGSAFTLGLESLLRTKADA
jgi:hypothetical protein